MKKVFLAALALIFTVTLFSCDRDDLVEDEILFETQSTEGDDGNIPPPPPGGNP